MAGDKREVRVAVVGDAGQLQRELLKAEGKLNSFGANAKTAGDTLRTAVFGGAVLYGAKQLVDAASNLQQAIGGTAAVFEQASQPVNQFAKDAANLAGLSEEAARTLTSRLGASLKGFGLSAEDAAKQSVFLAQTGADLAATLGGSTDEAVTALGAALRGEYDPLERFGIALKASDVAAKAVSMGLATNTSEVSTLAKGQAALALITEKSSFAQGQFAKESDTAAGQAAIAAAKTKNASADLGKALLPIYTKIQEVVAAVADVFSALPGPVQTGVIALTAVALVGPKIYSGISAATSAVRALPAALEKAALQAVNTQSAIAGMNISTQAAGSGATAAAGGMSLLGPAAIAVGAAAVIGGLAWKQYSDEQAAVAKDIKQLRDTFDELTGAMTENTYETVKANLVSRNQIDNLNKAGIGVRQFTDVLDDNRDSLVKQGTVEGLLRVQLEQGTGAIRNQIDEIRARGGAQNELIARLLETNAADKGLINTLYNGIDAYNEQQKAVRELNIQKSLQAGKSMQQAEAEANLAAESEKVSKSLEKQLKATNDLRGAQISEEEAQIKNRKALEDYNKSLGDGSLTADQRRQSELDLEKTYRDSIQAAVDAAEAQAILNGKTLTTGESAAIQSQKYNELADTLAADNPLRKRLKDLSFELFLLSLNQPEIRIKLETEAAIAKLRAFIGLTEQDTIGLGDLWNFSANWNGRATGGPVSANTPYMVGEKGPELFVPSSYGRIVDAFSTSKALLSNSGGGMAGGSANNVTINVSVAPTADKAAIGQTIVEAISSYERRSGDGWRN